ncbi:hypothetical protein EDD29_4596 [Actinocorallia herbida]|uniref:Uncharacterized protein n=1 Tax=Actinocorallia herbida TaxID=58109 RepID=A0A3N1D1R5_9ACTN|nr:hypothetical protein [Actinocorallia herbida]ROO87008.1 hypothetical protein EDD29_4596 [Actinocorallia herbida]
MKMISKAAVLSAASLVAGGALLYRSATVSDGLLTLALVLALFAGVSLVVAVTVVRALRAGPQAIWLALPVLILAASFATTDSDLPERVLLSAIDDDLRRIAESGEPGRAGLYKIEEPMREGTAVLLQVAGTGFIFAHAGFIYAPDGPGTIPPLGEGFESLDYEHISGPWYEYYVVES